MPRKSNYDQLVNSISKRLRELDHTKATSVEQALSFEQTICNAFGTPPSTSGSYDMCPVHPAVVRFHGQCHLCPDDEYEGE